MSFERLFERWQSNPRFPTLVRIYRRVYVDMYKALPGCVGGFVRDRNLTVRSEGIRFEAYRMMKETWHHITKTDVKATARPVSMVLAMPAQRQTLAVVHPQVHSAPQAQRPQSA